jgi:hypothetical protein
MGCTFGRPIHRTAVLTMQDVSRQTTMNDVHDVHDEHAQWLIESVTQFRKLWLPEARLHWKDQLFNARWSRSIEFNIAIFHLLAVDMAVLESLPRRLAGIEQVTFTISRMNHFWNPTWPEAVENYIAVAIGRVLETQLSLRAFAASKHIQAQP